MSSEDNGGSLRQTLYQDEWRMGSHFTADHGVRHDHFQRNLCASNEELGETGELDYVYIFTSTVRISILRQ